ncbi:MAG: glycoside hydrolase family 52 protein [Fimbriimonadaceae bacterium]|nr:glycoside hydrolase family 52 protein [Fimbriimonadaceae bacterium]
MTGKHPNLYNTQHSPLGAFSTFTLGDFGAKGGFGCGLSKPADESVFIGYKTPDGKAYSLPFFEQGTDDAERYDVEGGAKGGDTIQAISPDEFQRTLGMTSDTWEAGPLSFRILTPLKRAPEPGHAPVEAIDLAYLPSILAELTFDNTEGQDEIQVFFGYCGKDPYSAMRPIQGDKVVGVAQGSLCGIFAQQGQMEAKLHHDPLKALNEQNDWNKPWQLGTNGFLVGTVAPGELKTFDLSICFYQGGDITTGRVCRFAYTQYFLDLEDVADVTFDRWFELRAMAEEDDNIALESKDQSWLLAQAVHSYFASTQLLIDDRGELVWVVNEGEYRMMNTFDLLADHLFFELDHNPWTVRNALDQFADRYSYHDQVVEHESKKIYPGGVSFTHDMGVCNNFSPIGRSSYEKAELDDCFSFMTMEQLTNWILCAWMYVHVTEDWGWVRRRHGLLLECLDSLLARDHPDPSLRNGVMKLDSSFCALGAEITTYDSLDQSLGQARNNLYLAVKTWAAYIALESIFDTVFPHDRAQDAKEGAGRVAETVAAALREDGTIPAVLGEGVESRIIPAIEGLAFPLVAGRFDTLEKEGPYGHLISALETHLKTVLRPGICLFSDGGWKMSSTSENSWLSKIFLCQFVSEAVFGLPLPEDRAKADEAHVNWLLHPESRYWAFSDQIVSGIAKGSKYYPRGVTAWLWLNEDPVV